MNFFKYRSKKDPTKMVEVGQRDDGTLFLSEATFLRDEENYFETIEQIEELLDDNFEMVIIKQ